MSDPKLLLVHGGWAGGWVWEPLLEPLRRRGIDAEAIERLPSVGEDATALGDLDDDADHLRLRIDRIGSPVVLCAQSYGGMVITEVADHPAVVHSVYVAALWPQRGQAVFDLFGGEVPDWIVEREGAALSLTSNVERARQVLCADADPSEWAQFHALMRLQSEASTRTTSTAPARSHPVTYVICKRDEAVPVEAQEAWAAAADDVVRLDTAHMPQLSAPEDLAEVLARIVTEVPATQPAA